MDAGTTIGHYKIIRPLGKGGMGEVYLAEDTKLDRQVAVKILPETLRNDSDRLARFRREAKAAARLKHPNISTIHALEAFDDVLFITMEYVEGKTLAELIPHAGMDLDTFFSIFIPLADALAHAHNQGRIHRDLKPGNIVVADDGTPKILDFGLARIVESDAPLYESDISEDIDSQALTMTMKAEEQGVPSLTRGGQLMGTPQYMSPEQAESKSTDARTDIFSFGIVMYEALTGQRPFRGDNVESIIGRILAEEPKPVTEIKPVTPYTLWWTIRKCLTKDRTTRLQTAAELHADLCAVQQDVQSGTTLIDASSTLLDTHQSSFLRPLYTVAFALLLASLAATTVWLLKPTSEVELRKFPLTMSNGTISPDGSMIVYLKDDRLWVRELDRIESRALQDTEGARKAFWSPDSDFIGYQIGNTLWRISARGGQVTPLCELPPAGTGPSKGFTWGTQGTIVFDRFPNLYEVSAQGGIPRLLAAPDSTRSERGLYAPSFLPDGHTLLTNVIQIGDSAAVEVFVRRFNSITLAGYYRATRTASVKIAVQRENGERRILSLPDNFAQYPVYSPTGHLIYSTFTGDQQSSTILAVPFSLSTLETEDEAFPIANEVNDYSVSSEGTLFYRNAPPGGTSQRFQQLAWVDRSGRIQRQIGRPQEDMLYPALSPDGAFVGISAVENGNRDIWLHESSGTGKVRMTFHEALDYMPIWSPDGHWIVYNSEFGPGNRSDFYFMKAEERTTPFQLGLAPRTVGGLSWTPDGRYVAFHMASPETHRDLWYLKVNTTPDTVVMGATPVLLYQTKGVDVVPMISPNGRYVAYVSDKTGRPEVYVRPFPDGRGEWQVSSGGGASPQWSHEEELFYVDYKGNNLMALKVDTRSGRFGKEEPRPLFSGDPINVRFDRIGGRYNNWLFAPSPDGRRFVVMQDNYEETLEASTVTIVQNWVAEFESQE